MLNRIYTPTEKQNQSSEPSLLASATLGNTYLNNGSVNKNNNPYHGKQYKSEEAALPTDGHLCLLTLILSQAQLLTQLIRAEAHTLCRSSCQCLHVKTQTSAVKEKNDCKYDKHGRVQERNGKKAEITTLELSYKYQRSVIIVWIAVITDHLGY